MSKEQIPFEFPESLVSYAEQYQQEPEKTINRFKKQLERRGPDAVGSFLLAWFYYQQNEQEEALEYAVKAKTLAPGSPFLEKVHYFFSHPSLFDAWTVPRTDASEDGIEAFASDSELNSLIEKLSEVESKRIKFDPEADPSGNDQAYDTKEVEGIVSETLAKVHEQQGNNHDAIRVYKMLKKVNNDRSEFYDQRIQQLED